MDNLGMQEGQFAQFRLTKLPKAKYLKVKPVDFRLVEAMVDPRVALEHALRGFTTVTKGDCLALQHHGVLHCC